MDHEPLGDDTIASAPIDWLKPSIHPAYARLLCAHLVKQGISLDDLFSDSSLTWDTLKQQDFISFVQFNQIYRNGIARTNSPCLALDIDSMAQMSVHGILGHGALSAPTIGQSLSLVEKALSTRIKFFALTVNIEHDQLVIELDQQIELSELAEFIYIMLLGSLLDLLTKTAGQLLSQICVYFPFARPTYFSLYQVKFPHIDFSFSSRCFTIKMPAQLINEPCLTADELAYQHALNQCSQLLFHQSSERPLALLITSELFDIARLSPVNFPTQQQMAQRHNMSVRTMIRKLKREQSSYQRLMDDVRQELASWYLHQSSLTIEVIAQRLGFQDTSNFSRVFKRWYQTTPRQFKRQRETS